MTHFVKRKLVSRTESSCALALLLASTGGCTLDVIAPSEDTAEVESNIIGGRNANAGEWPWQVLIRKEGEQHCGGVVLSRDWVLTAAHCVFGVFNPTDPALFTIIGGDHVLSSSSPNEQTRTAAEIIIHPNYGSDRRVGDFISSGNSFNDVALIRVNQPFTLNQRVRTIPLSNTYPDTGEEIWATGWGITDSEVGEPSDVLQEVQSAVVDPAECAAVMKAELEVDVGPDSPVRIEGSHICMGKLAPNPHSSCSGDSGGPLVTRDAVGNFTLAGITSWGSLGCDSYGVYGHVRAMKPWIESVMNGSPVHSCSGRTIAGHTGWNEDSPIFPAPRIGPDTSACGAARPSGLTREKMYFTSLGGTSAHWTARGANNPTVKSFGQDGANFLIRLSQGELNAALAESRKYRINWEEVTPGLSRADLCTGRTQAGNTGWQQYGENGVYLDIYMGACPFSPISAIFTSLGSNFHASDVRGVTSIYPLSDGFRVYLNLPGITTEVAEVNGWQLNWQAIPYGTNNSEACVGRTSPDTTPWIAYEGGGGIYADVDTSACGETRTPTYLTSLGGTSRHWATTGVTSIYSPTPTGFRVYIRTTETVADARRNKWHVNWKVLRN
jgi:secreted trypsin-like serine protease